MSTIGRNHVGPARTWAEECSYCGVMWLRTDMVRNADGYLACPDDREGRTAIEIDAQRASDASEVSVIRGKKFEGP